MNVSILVVLCLRSSVICAEKCGHVLGGLHFAALILWTQFPQLTNSTEPSCSVFLLRVWDVCVCVCMCYWMPEMSLSIYLSILCIPLLFKSTLEAMHTQTDTFELCLTHWRSKTPTHIDLIRHKTTLTRVVNTSKSEKTKFPKCEMKVYTSSSRQRMQAGLVYA